VTDRASPDRFLSAVAWVEADELPPPARELLDHRRTMTEVLAEHFACEVDLRVLESCTDPEIGVYRRRIVLVTREGRRVVEHGWLTVELGALPPRAAEELVAGDAPFGRHLRTLATEFRIEPDRWFRAVVEGEVAEGLGVRAGARTVGRCSRIVAVDDGRVLARAVEVLAPLEESAPAASDGSRRSGA